MRISSLELYTSSKTQQRAYLGNKSNHSFPAQVNFSSLVFPSENFGRSMVHFKGENQEADLNLDYFHLPPGCKPYGPQIEVAKACATGNDVLAVVPTGDGKTAMAHYITSKNLAEGARTFYTSPLKALSSEKFRDFQRIYGEENVGMLTGDIHINPDAPIVLMTQEIYNNMCLSRKLNPENEQNRIKWPKTVVLDELQFLADKDRGRAWEQSIILTNKDTQLLLLSGTIGNPEEMAGWPSAIRGKRTVLVHVPPEQRRVPLNFILKGAEGITKRNGISVPTDDAHINLIENELRKKGKLPVIDFIPSKKTCKRLLEKLQMSSNAGYTTQDEKEKIDAIIKEHRAKGYLGESFNFDALRKGFAMHNAGMLPSQKALVEEVGKKGLVKVTFATGTLEAGIDYPVPTVIQSSITVPTSTHMSGEPDFRFVTVNEFHQKGGRAGHGRFARGDVYCLYTDDSQKAFFAELINSHPDPIKSQFTPEYSFIAKCFSSPKGDEVIREIIANSLCNFTESERTSKDLLAQFEDRKNVLKLFQYIDENNLITAKGKLLAGLNGYSQIPIINLVHDKINELANMKPTEIAGYFGMLASADEAAASQTEQFADGQSAIAKDIDTIRASNQRFADRIQESYDYFMNYNALMREHSEFMPVSINTKVANHIYTWANLNQVNSSNVRKNWRILYKKFNSDLQKGVKRAKKPDKRGSHAPMVEEGDLFKELTKGIDFLNQLKTIAQKAYTIPELAENKELYSKLASLAKEAIALIAKEQIIIR